MNILIGVIVFIIGFWLGVNLVVKVITIKVHNEHQALVSRNGKPTFIPDTYQDTYHMDNAKAEAKRLLDTIYSK